jgi:hypothetical protein
MLILDDFDDHQKACEKHAEREYLDCKHQGTTVP